MRGGRSMAVVALVIVVRATPEFIGVVAPGGTFINATRRGAPY